MKKITRFLFLLVAAPFLFCGCNQEDDVNEIFDSGVWYFVNYYTSVDWNSNNDRHAKEVYTEESDINDIAKFTITFKSDGTFSGTLIGGGIFSGHWEAEAEDRTFAVIGDVRTNIGLSGKNQEFITKLKEAQFYRGDSRMMLRLAPKIKTTCMQFAHYN